MHKHVLQVMFQLRIQLLYEYGLNSSTYSDLYAAYQYLVTLSVTVSKSNAKDIFRRLNL
jgi:hypothetical protein